jgi:hypothetical protein
MEIIQLNVAVTLLFCFERFFTDVHLNNIIEQTNTNLLIKILFYRFPSDNQQQHELKKYKSEFFSKYKFNYYFKLSRMQICI